MNLSLNSCLPTSDPCRRCGSRGTATPKRICYPLLEQWGNLPSEEGRRRSCPSCRRLMRNDNCEYSLSTRAEGDTHRSRLRRPKRDACRRVPAKNFMKRLKTPSDLQRVSLSISGSERNVRPFVRVIPEPLERHRPTGRWGYTYERGG